MTAVLWTINIVLALAFVIAGLRKLTRPLNALADSGMTWVNETSAQMVRAIGAIEILAGLGLIVPKATGIATELTPLAAIGLATLMLAAMVVHLQRAEPVVAPVILGGVAVVSAGLGFALL